MTQRDGNSHGLMAVTLRSAIVDLLPKTEDDATKRAISFAAAASRHESGYASWWPNQSVWNWLTGRGFVPEGVTFEDWRTAVDNCANFGAVQYHEPGLYTSPELSGKRPWPLYLVRDGRRVGVLYHDSNPTETEGNQPYAVYLKRYPTFGDGVADLVTQLYVNRPAVLSAAVRGDYQGFAETMYDTRYYRGRGPDRATRVAGYRRSIVHHCTVFCRAVGWEMPHGAAPTPAMLRVGDSGPDVLRLETILAQRGYLDGRSDTTFDDVTKRAVEALQLGRGLSVDGIVGVQTWTELLRPTEAPSETVEPREAETGRPTSGREAAAAAVLEGLTRYVETIALDVCRREKCRNGAS